MVKAEKSKSFLFIYLKEHLRSIPQYEAMDAIGYENFTDILEGKEDHFTVKDLINLLNDLDIDRDDILDSARFHASLRQPPS